MLGEAFSLSVVFCSVADVVGELYCYRTVGCRSLIVSDLA
jgi:hypothetical protein